MKCDYCENYGTWEIDPYRYEIYGEIIWMILCDFCFDLRKDDI